MSGMRFSILLVCVALAGCAWLFPPHIDDVKVTSLKIINSWEQSDISNALPNLSGNYTLLSVGFSTSANLLRLMRDGEYNIFSRVGFCQGEGEFDQPNQIISGVFDEDGLITFSRVSRKESASGPIFDYHLYVNVHSIKTVSFPQQIDYDLGQSPRDLCLEIRGENIWVGRKFITNTFVVSREALSAAFSRYGSDKNPH